MYDKKCAFFDTLYMFYNNLIMKKYACIYVDGIPYYVIKTEIELTLFFLISFLYISFYVISFHRCRGIAIIPISEEHNIAILPFRLGTSKSNQH